MTTAENSIWPAWSHQERRRDLEWIRENIQLFHEVAAMAFEEVGRGAIVVDVTVRPIPDRGHPLAYFGQQEMDQAFDDDTRRMVEEYDPAGEVVLVLLKSLERTSTYRVGGRPQCQPATGTPGLAPGARNPWLLGCERGRHHHSS